VVDAEKMRRELNFKSVHLLNDLEAIAAAIPLLQADDLHTINPGHAMKGGAMAVIAPGTGLGEGFLTWDGTRYNAHPSEGGHADFPPTDAIQVGLLQRLQKRYNHVSLERVCSGNGIPNIYDYLRESGHAAETPEIARRLEEAKDRTPVIVKAALDPAVPSPLCRAALETFVSILGAEASNMALKVMATGGVYLAGGIPPRIVPALEDGRFMEIFRRKGRLSEVLEGIPVHIVVCRAALIGAASRGLELAEKETSSNSDS
jgi:glucokinase